MNPRRGAIYLEVDVTDEDVRRGRLLVIAWIYRCRIGWWQDGSPRPSQLRDDLAAAALIVGYDLHRTITPHIAHRHGLCFRWPQADLRSMLALLPAELQRRFLPSDSGQHGIMRRLNATRAAWNWLRTHR